MLKRLLIAFLFSLTLSVAPSAFAQSTGVPQPEKVRYSLIGIYNATDDTVAEATATTVKLKFAVSIPRKSTRYGVPSYASPVRIMARAHKGETTAFDGTIVLKREAPLARGGTADSSNFYPMPQKNATVNRASVLSGSTRNVNGFEVYGETGYVALGTVRDPARWEALFVTETITVASNEMVKSLLKGDATYEWYGASNYGSGSITRLSDIQDLGRKQDFTDSSLWTPIASASDTVDEASKATLGSHTEYVLSAMGGGTASATTWHLYRGAIGANASGQMGVQLLNVEGTDPNYADYARLESPRFPDGVERVTFKALSTGSDSGVAIYPLIIQYFNGSAWETLPLAPKDAPTTWPEGAMAITQALATYTVDFKGALSGATARFRIVRPSKYQTEFQSMNAATYVISELRVVSASPKVTFEKPLFTTGTGTAVLPAEKDPFTLSLTAKPVSTSNIPRGYSAKLSVTRRADGLSGGTYSAPMTVTTNVLSFAFTPGIDVAGKETGAPAAEGAFFLNKKNELTGLRANVYNYKVDVTIEGSFLAGREEIDLHESEKVIVSETPANPPTDDADPYVIDLRQQKTERSAVALHVMVRVYNTETSKYHLEKKVFACEPSSTQEKIWRVALPRVYQMTQAERDAQKGMVYAWSAETGGTTADKFDLSAIPFTVSATVPTETEPVTWYGQGGTVPANVLPPVVGIVPAIREDLISAVKEAEAVPFLIALNSFDNAHMLVEVDFSAAAPAKPTVRICGTYDQNFNTWAVTEKFTKSEFREDVNAYVADFDCQTMTNAGSGNVSVEKGWIPDDGPLAKTTAFTERFSFAPDHALSPNEFYYNGEALLGDSLRHFASWGGAELRAEVSSLRQNFTGGNFRTKYMLLGENAEAVLSRSYRQINKDYYPDAMIRLQGQGSTLSPYYGNNAEVVLNGAGTMKFTLGISLPYDILKRAMILPYKGGSAANGTDYGTRGIASGLSIKAPSATGYSLSYYLQDISMSSTVIYELRITQMTNVALKVKELPKNKVVAEIFKWQNGTATRLAVQGAAVLSGGYFSEEDVDLSTANRSWGLWVKADGKIAAGWGAGLSASVTERFATVSTPLSGRVATAQMIAGVGSAECRPVFNFVKLSSVAGTAPATAVPQGSFAFQGIGFGAPAAWSVAPEGSSASYVRISRNEPSADLEGKVWIRAKRDGVTVYESYKTASDAGKNVTLILGSANSQVEITPADGSNVFIDDIYMSSWCGNDKNRNGADYVPEFTSKGDLTRLKTGYSAVGVWIRPESDRELTTSAELYSGKQMLLLQRSRRNTAVAPKEITLDTIRTTGNSLALYTPYSTRGFGTVRFKYRIPVTNEFKGGKNSSVSVMLQYLPKSVNYLDFLTSQPSGWKNASDILPLDITGDEWSVASLTPKDSDGKELIGVSGTLRLVLVTTGLDDAADPYVYIDDFTTTDNANGSTASWSATNAKLTATPISLLYWKDRLPGKENPPKVQNEQTPFALRSALSTGMQLNDQSYSSETDGNYDSCRLESPLLPNGAGTVTFATRTVAQGKTVRIYICASTASADAPRRYVPVTYVEVASDVWQTYAIDLTKYTKTYMVTRADGTLEPTTNSSAFNFNDATSVCLQTFVENGSSVDEFGGLSKVGRVMIDRVTISNPITASLRVKSIDFSNLAGTGEDEFSPLGRQSPLSQPVANASALRVRVKLDRLLLLKSESVRVFFTFTVSKPTAVGIATSNLHKYLSPQYKTVGTETIVSGRYSDVLSAGNVVEASSDQPVYGWDQMKRDQWPLSSWFKLPSASEVTVPPIAEGIGTPVGGTQTVTVELIRVGTEPTVFVGDLSQTALMGLEANDLVRYTAWAYYTTEDAKSAFTSQINSSVYTDFPWYFPRNLNLENRPPKGTSAEFTPYYWVYSVLPGEVFINEINGADNDRVPLNVKEDKFIELCAPAASVALAEWRVGFTGATSIDIGSSFALPITVNTLPPDDGVVPARRLENTSANRTFYTAVEGASLFYTDAGGAEKTDLIPYKNAGVANAHAWSFTSGNSAANSVILYRPTGGAEHIVVYSNRIAVPGIADSVKTQVNTLCDYYRRAYVTFGFGGEWYQEFHDSTATWKDDTTQSERAKDHGRRLVPVTVETVNGVADTPIVDKDSAAVANSIATTDMGGIWTSRKNSTVEKNPIGYKGPTDLTEFCTGDWAKVFNPMELARGGDTGKTVQVTPRQVNLNQYLFRYTDLSQNLVESSLVGKGSHQLTEMEKPAATWIDGITRLGGMTQQKWSVSTLVPAVKLTVTPIVFHRVKTMTLTLRNAKTGALVSTQTEIEAALAANPTTPTPPYTITIDAAGLVTLTPNVSASTTAEPWKLMVLLSNGTSASAVRYNLSFTTTFELIPDAAKDVITHVSPFCGTQFPGFAQWQPWWGSSFGFEIKTADPNTFPAASKIKGVIVTYPSPDALKTAPWGLNAPWSGTTVTLTPEEPALPKTLEGTELSVAETLLKKLEADVSGTRYVRIDGVKDNRIADNAVMPLFGNKYLALNGKEPAIPFCVWGIYTDTVPTAKGIETISFLMRQAAPATVSTVFTYPQWYRPLADKNGSLTGDATAPYFYLYSTPPQAAWLNEVNFVAGTGSGTAPYAEVVMPAPRTSLTDVPPGILPLTDLAGWQINWYGATGVALATPSTTLAGATTTGSTTASYTYNVVSSGLPTVEVATGKIAAVLMRPCGAAEGGVWTAVTTSSEKVVPPTTLTENRWLIPAETTPTTYGSSVFAGVSDAMDAVGSVQLTGTAVAVEGSPDPTGTYLSSNVTERKEWTFRAESRGDNNGISPDPNPTWNRISVTSVLKNIVFAGTVAGYQTFGLFDVGAAGTPDPLSAMKSEDLWTYNPSKFSLSYKLRAGYRFETLKVTPELIGRIMILGNPVPLTAKDLDAKVTLLLKGEAALPTEAEKKAYRRTAWLGLDGKASVTDEPNGVVTFTIDEKLFPDYYITLVFIDAPISASNTLTMSLGQGEKKQGQWLLTQTLFGLKAVAGADPIPDADKGGSAATKPLWNDEDGDGTDATTKNVHGWLYQPVVGDSLGMATVIDPESGLVTAGVVRDWLTAPNAQLRPFLVWNLIPQSKVEFPKDLTTKNKFMDKWDMQHWLGTAPNALRLPQLRAKLYQELQAAQQGTAFAYKQGGIVPLIYQVAQGNDPKKGALSFRTMKPSELAAALANSATGLVNDSGATISNQPYESSISMVGDDWQEGAILRFAIVIADAKTGTIYDWQSVTNFENKTNPIYCPWYLPNSEVNVNAKAKQSESGQSPYCWVYEVPRAAIWLNEFRPFELESQATDGSNTHVVIPSALELAMKPSALRGDGLPQLSLDGWKVIVRTASLPLTTDSTETSIGWREQNSISLKSWIPSARINLNQSTSADAYDLDYYLMTSDPTVGCKALAEGLQWRSHSDEPTTFNYLKTDKALAPVIPSGGETTSYPNGCVYSLILVRANGAVEDQVLFYHDRAGGGMNDEGDGPFLWADRMAKVETSETFHHTTVGKVRSIAGHSLGAMATSSPPFSTAQLLSDLQTPPTFNWVRDLGDTQYNTLPGPNYSNVNGVWTFAQPKSTQKGPILTTAILSAQLMGGQAQLDLNRVDGVGTGWQGAPITSGSALIKGTRYRLSVNGWDPAWLDFKGVTANGVAVDPSKISSALSFSTCYTATTAGTLATASAIQVDDTLNVDTDYIVLLRATKEAQMLANSQQLGDSSDAGFMDWVHQAKPGDILTAAAADGLTAAEKYWLGSDSAAVNLSDVALSVTEIGSYVEPVGGDSESLGTPKPTLSLRLVKGTEPITTLRGDGTLVLLGKVALSDAWCFVTTLNPADLDGEKTFILNTDCKFFKAVLISQRQANELQK